MKDVEGKIAFITGGDSGIGLGIARAFVNAGMKVAITYRTQSHLDNAMMLLGQVGSQVHAIELDVTDRFAIARAATETRKLFGKIHVLVANAGIGGGPLSGSSPDEWDWCMSVNVTGVFNCIHAFLPYLKAHGEGAHITATSSIHGLVAGPPSITVYTATKFAVVGLMEGLRSELSHSNVGISVFCPGRVNTNTLDCNRNRPATLRVGTPDPDLLLILDRYSRPYQDILDSSNGSPGMDPLEAGECVLDGIRNNDLYILSHAEYEEAILARNKALLASLPKNRRPLPRHRVALERLFRACIYSRNA